MAVSVDHNSTMSDLRDFIKENKLKITTSGPGRTKDKILAEIKAMITNDEVTEKSSGGGTGRAKALPHEKLAS